MNRHRSTSRSARAAAAAAARESESRQPEEDGRRSGSSRLNLLGNGGNNNDNNNNNNNNNNNGSSTNNKLPRTPRSTASSSASGAQAPGIPPAPHSAPNSFPKTRCYRLNLEKPFDIRQQKSPLGRDYSGPPVHDSDLPPAQGPVEYHPPPHLCSKEDLWRRHSFGGYGNNGSVLSGAQGGGASTPSDLMADLHVSMSEESSKEASDPTTIAISTARIFRGIVVDRNGVITSMNSRAMRSQRGKNGGDNKNKMGEKSRQAAKIDKAKDLIDEVAEGGGGGMVDEENDPSKIVSLFVMGEYEDLNDLVRDGSKKLRDSKSLSDEAVFMYNRPKQFPPGMHPSQQQQPLQPMAVSSSHGNSNSMVLSQTNSPYHSPVTSPKKHYSSGNGGRQLQDAGALSPTGVASNVSSPSNLRKRVFSADKSRGSRYKSQGPRSAPPKIKGHPRDPSSGGRGRSGRAGGSSNPSGAPSGGAPSSPTTGGSGAHNHHGYHRNNSVTSHHAAQQQGVHGMLNCNPAGSPAPADGSTGGNNKPHHYFPQQCNFFPGNSDWTEALGFSVNSLWNCGANGGHLSPTMSPHSTSPRSSHNGGGGAPPAPTTGGGVYHGSGAAVGYHQSASGYHHPSSANSGNNPGYGGGGAYGHYSTSGGGQYRGVDEGRNPSHGGYGGYGTGRTGTGVRDTVVM